MNKMTETRIEEIGIFRCTSLCGSNTGKGLGIGQNVAYADLRVTSGDARQSVTVG